MANTTKKNIVLSDDMKTAFVTKKFAKNARIFGTPEFKEWMAFQREMKDVYGIVNIQMVTKSIAKNPDKETNRNKTYDNMREYIIACAKSADEREAMLNAFKVVITKSKIQSNPYRYVLAYFEETYGDFDGNYKQYFENKRKAREEEKQRALYSNITKFPATENKAVNE